jgi:Spy/CpxP family protein refolding chaperone
MHAAFLHEWMREHRHGRHGEDRCGPGGERGPGRERGREGFEGFGGWHAHGFGHGDEGGSQFGVRRPLRFLSYKLDLEENQTTELAKILDDLKTERAQGAVDDRRAVAAFAEAVAGGSFDAAKAAEAAKQRAASAERLGKAVTKALEQIHALLKPEQREQLAYLVRTGTLSL